MRLDWPLGGKGGMEKSKRTVPKEEGRAALWNVCKAARDCLPSPNSAGSLAEIQMTVRIQKST